MKINGREGMMKRKKRDRERFTEKRMDMKGKIKEYGSEGSDVVRRGRK